MARLSAKVRREDFIVAAARVIATTGVSGATTRKIAAEAGAPLAALHYCFESKEALFQALYEEQIKTMGESTWTIKPGIGVAETAAAMVPQLMEWYEQEPDYAQASGDLMFWSHHNDRALAELGVNAALEVMRETLRKGVSGPEERKLVEPLATLVLALTDGLLLQWLTFKDTQLRDKGVAAAMRALRCFAN